MSSISENTRAPVSRQGLGMLLPAGPAYGSTNWILTFGSIVLVLSFILLSRVRGIWPTLWRTLLVTGVSAAIIFAVATFADRLQQLAPGQSMGSHLLAAPFTHL